eukprot:CAMPEP_0167802374 /NCGR_PEP_ID=MMETSP0111_2-20121227/19093_1 /TAXON_ID=91324 /ORGANISM="Lotharella globosa, Strain CCCM811" /LENGTH=110 /DNA_ID=CAMNT_0007698421 /DNA_START=127 /DNA_END=455 /DNA_ORIENTATION=+
MQQNGIEGPFYGTSLEMQAFAVETREQRQEVILAQLRRALFLQLGLLERLVDDALNVNLLLFHVVQRAVHLVVLLQHRQHVLVPEDAPDGLVLPREAQPDQAIPLREVDR